MIVDLYLPSESLPPVIFHLVVLFWGSPRHQGKLLSLSLLYSRADAPCTKWHLNKVWRYGIRDSVWVILKWSYGSDFGFLCFTEPPQRAQNPTSPACLSPRVCDSSPHDFSIIHYISDLKYGIVTEPGVVSFFLCTLMNS